MKSYERKPVQKTTYDYVSNIRCDGCGLEIFEDLQDEYDQEANELFIALNQHQCVSMLRYRDYCTECLEPVWDAIMKLIKADPDTEREEGFYEREG